MVKMLRGTAAFAFIALNTVFWFVPIFVLGMIRPLLPKRFGIALGSAMLRALNGWVGCARWMVSAFGVARIEMELDARHRTLRRDGWYLVVCNHQSWADVLVLVIALYGLVPPLKFFTKRELIWVPFVGIALRLLEFPFVRRYGRERLQADPALRQHDRNAVLEACTGFREQPSSVLSFLEGTRFTLAKRDAQESPYQALLKPKTRGFALVLHSLADRLDAVVDGTIFYSEKGAPGFWDFLCGRCPTVRFSARVLPPPPVRDEALRDWVARLWEEKDVLLSSG